MQEIQFNGFKYSYLQFIILFDDNTGSPVGLDYRIHRLHLFKGVILPQWVSWIYDFKPSDGEASVSGALGNI